MSTIKRLRSKSVIGPKLKERGGNFAIKGEATQTTKNPKIFPKPIFCTWKPSPPLDFGWRAESPSTSSDLLQAAAPPGEFFFSPSPNTLPLTRPSQPATLPLTRLTDQPRPPPFPSAGSLHNSQHSLYPFLSQLVRCCEDCRKNWTSHEEVKDWRFCHEFQNNEERWIRR